MTDLSLILRCLIGGASVFKLKWAQEMLMAHQDSLSEPDSTLAQLLTEIENRIKELETPMIWERCLRCGKYCQGG